MIVRERKREREKKWLEKAERGGAGGVTSWLWRLRLRGRGNRIEWYTRVDNWIRKGYQVSGRKPESHIEETKRNTQVDRGIIRRYYIWSSHPLPWRRLVQILENIPPSVRIFCGWRVLEFPSACRRLALAYPTSFCMYRDSAHQGRVPALPNTFSFLPLF